jgi:hypothetical protein
VAVQAVTRERGLDATGRFPCCSADAATPRSESPRGVPDRTCGGSWHIYGDGLVAEAVDPRHVAHREGTGLRVMAPARFTPPGQEPTWRLAPCRDSPLTNSSTICATLRLPGWPRCRCLLEMWLLSRPYRLAISGAGYQLTSSFDLSGSKMRGSGVSGKSASGAVWGPPPIHAVP